MQIFSCQILGFTVMSMKMAVFWDVAPYSLVDTDQSRGAYCLPNISACSLLIALMMEAVEMLVSIYHTTWCNIPEASHLQIFSCLCYVYTSISHTFAMKLMKMKCIGLKM
jgi:hypothetical protein